MLSASWFPCLSLAFLLCSCHLKSTSSSNVPTTDADEQICERMDQAIRQALPPLRADLIERYEVRTFDYKFVGDYFIDSMAFQQLQTDKQVFKQLREDEKFMIELQEQGKGIDGDTLTKAGHLAMIHSYTDSLRQLDSHESRLKSSILTRQKNSNIPKYYVSWTLRTLQLKGEQPLQDTVHYTFDKNFKLINLK